MTKISHHKYSRLKVTRTGAELQETQGDDEQDDDVGAVMHESSTHTEVIDDGEGEVSGRGNPVCWQEEERLFDEENQV